MYGKVTGYSGVQYIAPEIFTEGVHSRVGMRTGMSVKFNIFVQVILSKHLLQWWAQPTDGSYQYGGFPTTFNQWLDVTNMSFNDLLMKKNGEIPTLARVVYWLSPLTSVGRVLIK